MAKAPPLEPVAYKVSEVARMLNLSDKSTVYTMIVDGRIKGAFKLGQQWRIPASEVDRLRASAA